jgi:hypothetical protein
MKVLIVLAILVAIVYGQTFSNLDPFDGVSSKLDVPGTSAESFSDSTVQSDILGGERDMIIRGTGTGSSSNCESETFVENGAWFANNGQTCAASAVLQYDGVDGSGDLTMGLGLDLNSFGAAFVVDIQTDLTTSFTIEVYSSQSAVSSVTQTIQASSTLIPHVFAYGAFSGSADFGNVGAIQLIINENVNTDVIVTLFDIISNEISGRVFSDCNCDGNFDGDDAGVSGITVTGTPNSDCGSGTESQTAVTVSDGTYLLEGLAACTYTVSISSANNPCGSNQITADATLDPTNVDFNLELAGAFSVPADITITCAQLVGGSPPTSVTGTATADGACGGSGGAVNFEDSVISNVCDSDFVVNRRWFAGSEEGFQVITVTDTNTGPSLNVPSSVSIECTESSDPSNTGTATATDDCSSNVSVDFVDASTFSCNENLCGQSEAIERTWTAIDDCGNTATGVQLISRNPCDGSTPITCPTGSDDDNGSDDEGLNDDDNDCLAPQDDDDLCICPVGDDDDDDFGSCIQSSDASSIFISFSLIAALLFFF